MPKAKTTKHPKELDVIAPTPKKEKGVKCITFKKYTISKIMDWLTIVVTNPGTPSMNQFPLALHGPKARARNKIVGILREEFERIEADRIAICEEFCKKEDGKSVMNENGSYNILPENQAKFDEAFTELMKEEVSFDILPSNQNDWNMVRVIILTELRTEMAFAETAMYEDVCVAFENM